MPQALPAFQSILEFMRCAMMRHLIGTTRASCDLSGMGSRGNNLHSKSVWGRGALLLFENPFPWWFLRFQICDFHQSCRCVPVRVQVIASVWFSDYENGRVQPRSRKEFVVGLRRRIEIMCRYVLIFPILDWRKLKMACDGTGLIHWKWIEDG